MNNLNSTVTIKRGVPRPLTVEPFAEEAQWICRQHEILSHDDLETIARKAAVGEVLCRIKAEIKAAGGAWIPWTKRNLPGISHRTVCRYMEIYRRSKEPLAYEDPEAFLAQIYGNTTEEENDDASDPQSNRTLTSNLPPAEGKKSP